MQFIVTRIQTSEETDNQTSKRRYLCTGVAWKLKLVSKITCYVWLRETLTNSHWHSGIIFFCFPEWYFSLISTVSNVLPAA